MADPDTIAGTAPCCICGEFSEVTAELAAYYDTRLSKLGVAVDPERFRLTTALHLVDCPNREKWHPEYQWQTAHICTPCRPRIAMRFACCGETFHAAQPFTESDFQALSQTTDSVKQLHVQTCTRARDITRTGATA